MVNQDSPTGPILCQEAERKEREKQESLVKGLEEGVREKAVQGRRDYAAVQHAAVEERREEIRLMDTSCSNYASKCYCRLLKPILDRRTSWPRDWQGGGLEKKPTLQDMP